MCTQIRNIDELLSMTTYQGMSDDEIEAIINYHVQQAIINRETSETIQALSDTQNQMIADNRAAALHAANVLQSVLEKTYDIEFPTLEFVTVNPETVRLVNL